MAKAVWREEGDILKQTMSLPLYSGSFIEYHGWDDMRRELARLGCEGLEGVWSGEAFPPDLPSELIIGYHLLFYPDWLDFYRDNKAMLVRKFGALNTVECFYGGLDPEILLKQYQQDLERAASLNAEYVVFHVSDVSIEEGYTYRWLLSNQEVIDTAIEIINLILGERDWPFVFLVENQWWPGFTFTNPEETARLIGGIRYPKKGIMLDTGHLMNTNTSLRTQREGAAYLRKMLDTHGSLCRYIQGVHLHQSLSGPYVTACTGKLPTDLPRDYLERFAVNYSHILRIDQHLPWTDPAILPVLERIEPHWLTHELSSRNRRARAAAVMAQTTLLRGGGLACG